MSIKTIVAALALQYPGDQVALRAMQLTQQHGARLIVVHVIEDFSLADHNWPAATDKSAVIAALKDEAATQLSQMFAASSITPEIVIETGKSHDIINAVAQRESADLVVIGPGKPRNIREKIIGSTADRMVRSSDCPVLIVKRDASADYQRVFAAMDFSEISETAAEFAFRIAPTATIELVHAVEIPLTFEQAMLNVGTPTAEIEIYRKSKMRSAREQLLDVLSGLTDLPSAVRTRVVYGSAGAALIHLSKRADLIVVGTQGKSAVSRLLLGSVARKVIYAASCDVLACPPSALNSRIGGF